ncbi:MAG: polysaccharide export protein [Candidatus Omnitrophica bacterium]|nr:polysaccharide export protein [Candidatus Omnitrophota bacterium]
MSFWRFVSHLAFFVLFLPVVVTTCLIAAESPLLGPMDSSDLLEEYHIGGNDVLEITVYGEEDLSREVQVTGSGYISYPLLGRIKVAGMSAADLEDYIRQELARKYIRDPQVGVFVKEFSNVYVLGQVKEPGPYPYKGGMTVVQAITSAGGFSKIANQRKVRVVRKHGDEQEMFYVNVHNVTNGNAEDIMLQPGDTVVVPESFF